MAAQTALLLKAGRVLPAYGVKPAWGEHPMAPPQSLWFFPSLHEDQSLFANSASPISGGGFRPNDASY